MTAWIYGLTLLACCGYAAAWRRGVFFAAAAALHCAALFAHWAHAPRLDWATALSAFMLLTAVVAWRQTRPPLSRPLLLALSALSALTPLFFFADKPPPSASALAHILPSALASAFAASAMLQWMDLRLAENARRRLADTSAPPILTMEENCFRALRLSFWLLSLALLSGIGGMLAGGDAPAHKIIFAALAWLAFGGLLAGRRFRGWRGPAARWWLAAGLLFFILSYFGTHFVLQVLLGRVN